jgi:hypothetical protein
MNAVVSFIIPFLCSQRCPQQKRAAFVNRFKRGCTQMQEERRKTGYFLTELHPDEPPPAEEMSDGEDEGA